MKILQIINSHALEDGGAQRLALELHRAYRARGHDAHLLSLMRSPTDESGTYSLGFAKPYRARVATRLRRFLMQPRWKNVDVIHVHLFPAQLWVPLSLPRTLRRVPLVTTEHNTFNRRRESRLGRVLDGATLRAYQRIICISPATSEALAKWQPQLENRLITIPNGIDLMRLQGVPQGVPKASESKRIIIAVGRLAEQKNYATAIRAASQMQSENFELWIVGQDEMNGEMQHLCAELKQERIKFLGFQADIPALLARADVFLLTSKWEGFGLAVAEAMAMGLPVVASNVPGVREVVGTDERCGFLENPSAPAAFAARLDELLGAENRRREMGEAGKVRAAQFDIERTIEAHLRLFDEVVREGIGIDAFSE